MHLLFDESASDEGGMIKGVIIDFLACRLWLGRLLSSSKFGIILQFILHPN